MFPCDRLKLSCNVVFFCNQELSHVKATALVERSQIEEELVKAKNQAKLEEVGRVGAIADYSNVWCNLLYIPSHCPDIQGWVWIRVQEIQFLMTSVHHKVSWKGQRQLHRVYTFQLQPSENLVLVGNSVVLVEW